MKNGLYRWYRATNDDNLGVLLTDNTAILYDYNLDNQYEITVEYGSILIKQASSDPDCYGYRYNSPFEVTLYDNGVLFDEPDIPRCIEDECCRKLVGVEGDIIITIFDSEVLPPIFHLFDKNTYEFIGEQYLMKEQTFNGGMTWGSYGHIREEAAS